MAETPGAHREYLVLLPWYVNGSLAERDRVRLEKHLGECLPCHSALREERRLAGLIRDQDAVPLGPEHGKAALFGRIDRGGRAGRGFAKATARAVPWIGYGVAAALGGVVVGLWLAMAGPDDREAGNFETLSTTADGALPRIDVVFTAQPSGAELEAFRAGIGARLVAGPSEIGRYTFALERDSDAGVETLLESLRRDPNIRFAGRSYAATGDEGAAMPAAGGNR